MAGEAEDFQEILGNWLQVLPYTAWITQEVRKAPHLPRYCHPCR